MGRGGRAARSGWFQRRVDTAPIALGRLGDSIVERALTGGLGRNGTTRFAGNLAQRRRKGGNVVRRHQCACGNPVPGIASRTFASHSATGPLRVASGQGSRASAPWSLIVRLALVPLGVLCAFGLGLIVRYDFEKMSTIPLPRGWVGRTRDVAVAAGGVLAQFLGPRRR